MSYDGGWYYQLGETVRGTFVMKFLRQFAIILFVSFLGEILHILIPLPVPASVYGLLLMFTALCTGILKQEQVREAADFLIEDHAGHVHSCRRRAVGRLAGAAGHMDTPLS